MNEFNVSLYTKLIDIDLTLSGLGVVVAIYLVCRELWLGYIVWTALMERRVAKDMSLLDKVFGYPTIIIGLLWDVLVNYALATVALLELPHYGEYTLSTRCKRHAIAAIRYEKTAKLPDFRWCDIEAKWLVRWQWRVGGWVLSQIQKHDKSGYHTVTKGD